MIKLIVAIAIILICIVIFFTWFFSYAAEGKCPICALKSFPVSKLTIDTSNDEDYDNNGSATPIMGWSSWNTLRNHIDEDAIIDTARTMRDTGLIDAGYKYLNIDDCWQSSLRDSDGKLQGDLETFPSGMDNLCKTVNSFGMKLGLYSSNGTNTCEDLPASLGNEDLDAKTLASWGVEYLKYDFCHHEYINGSCPAIECIDLSIKGERASIHLAPEQAELTGKAKIMNIKELPTGKAIGMLNHNAGTATFQFNAEQSGEYVMTVHYSKTLIQRKQYMQAKINDTTYEVFFPSGRTFSADGRVQIMVKLLAGENTMTICNPVVTHADSSYIQYRRMAAALKNASTMWAMFTNTEEKPITFSICEWGAAKPWLWGAKAGNMWRTTLDINAHWQQIMHIYRKNVKLYPYAKPGHVNDPDMLEVGNGKLTPDENIAHFSLWCMMAAPLVLGNDIRKLNDGSAESELILSIVKNNSLLVIDQDPLVKQAKIIKTIGSIDILARPLYNGDVAICFFNKSNRRKPVMFKLNELTKDEYLNIPNVDDVEIHDLWSDDRFYSDEIKVPIPAHGVKVYRISRG